MGVGSGFADFVCFAEVDFFPLAEDAFPADVFEAALSAAFF
jgi:hypothetical protein